MTGATGVGVVSATTVAVSKGIRPWIIGETTNEDDADEEAFGVVDRGGGGGDAGGGDGGGKAT